MAQKYINGDIVMYYNNITVIKRLREEDCFDLFCPKEGLTYCFVDMEKTKPVKLNSLILQKNGWKKDDKWYKLTTKRAYLYITKDAKVNDEFLVCVGDVKHNLASVSFVHELQHLLYGLKINPEMEV